MSSEILLVSDKTTRNVGTLNLSRNMLLKRGTTGSITEQVVWTWELEWEKNNFLPMTACEEANAE